MWKPEKHERINEGHHIFLHIQGVSHPVVAMSVGVPPEHKDALS